VIENVELLNKVEPNESNEPEADESSCKFEPEADSINDTEEAKIEVEPNNLEPRVEPNVVELVKSSVNLELTIPKPTSLNAMNK
ncbi:hypothetical protein J1N35_034493, partial [Gossypium stocksii]